MGILDQTNCLIEPRINNARRTSYNEAFLMAIDWFPLWLSLRVAALSTAAALVIGLWVAWLLAKRPFRGRDAVSAAVTLPIVLPPTVLGYYLLVLLGSGSPLGEFYEWLFGRPLVFTWQAAAIAALFHSAPLMIHFIRSALESVDASFERAARTLGASEWKVFWRVSLPLAWKPILAATALAFARSMGDFGITIMIAGNIPGHTQTLSVAVYDAVTSGNGATARALVLVMSAIALLVVWAANRLARTTFSVAPGQAQR
jgi:molybdate transport system permease protein